MTTLINILLVQVFLLFGIHMLMYPDTPFTNLMEKLFGGYKEALDTLNGIQILLILLNVAIILQIHFSH